MFKENKGEVLHGILLIVYFRFLPFTLQNSSSSNNFPSAR